MALHTPTKTEQVFASKSINLSVTRFTALTDIQNGIQRKLSPGLRYAFGSESNVVGDDGDNLLEGGSIKVDDQMRRRDWQFIERYGHLYPAEVDEDWDTDVAKGKAQRKRFLSTEDFLRQRSVETGDFVEVEPAAPGSGDTLQRVIELAAEQDIEGLVAVAEQETAGWERQDVLDAVEGALTRLQEPEPAA